MSGSGQTTCIERSRRDGIPAVERGTIARPTDLRPSLGLSRWWRAGDVKVLLTCDDVVCLGPCQRSSRSAFQVTKRAGLYPRLSVDADGGSAVSQAGGVLLTLTVRAAGLDTEGASPKVRRSSSHAGLRRLP